MVYRSTGWLPQIGLANEGIHLCVLNFRCLRISDMMHFKFDAVLWREAVNLS